MNVTDMSWYPTREAPKRGDARAEVFVTRRNDRVFVSGSIKLVMLLVCDRCLDDFELPRDISFRVVCDLNGEDPALAVREYECNSNEMDVVFLDEPVIDLGNILTQQVLLAVPQKKLCRSNCSGLCPECGADLNKIKCNCRIGDDDSPFSILDRLTTKKNSD